MKGHVFEYDELVVGSSLPALLYCYKRCCPIIFKNISPPKIYEFLSRDINLENLFFLTNEKTIKMPSGQKIVGSSKLELHNRLLYVLSFAGLVPLSDKVEKIRLEKDLLAIATSRARTVKIKFEHLRVFDPTMISGLKIKNIKNQKSKVLDSLKIVCEKSEVEQINVGDDFINKIYFYDGNKIDVVSFLEREDVENFDFSIIPLRYKLKEIFKESGIKKRSYRSDIMLEHLERNVYNNHEANYEIEDNITIDKREEYEICQDTQHKTHSTLLAVYPWRLNHLFMDSSGMIR